MYATLPYFCARVLVDLPLKVLAPVLFGSIGYWSVGLQADGVKFANCLLTLVLLALCGNSIGLFLGCLFPDVSVALLVAPMESGYADRFAGPDSRYRKGLRASTIPEARDPSAFPAKKTIEKSSGVSRGAALKAALKARMTLGTVSETAEEGKENAIAIE